MSKAEGRFIKINFTEDIYNLDEAIDFEGFSLIFQEQLYIQSEIVETILEPIGVYYSDNIQEIILEFTSISGVAFRNVIGDINLIYNMDYGHLRGYGGLVQSFDITFTPVGLVKNLPTNNIENINEVEDGESESIKWGSGATELKRLEFGFHIEGGVELMENLQLGMSYNLGLNDISGDGNGGTKNRVFAITATYFFSEL